MPTPRILVLDDSEAVAAQVTAVAGELRPVPEVVTCARPGAVGDVLADDGPFDTFVAGPCLGTRTGLARLAVIREELPEMSIVLAFKRRPDAALPDIVRAGAVDFLQLPVEDKELRVAIDRALGLSLVGRATPAAGTPGGAAGLAPTAGLMPNGLIPPPPPPPRTPGRVVTITSATGGCGKTFFATNLAYFLDANTSGTACIVDLDLQFGEVSTTLRLRPKYTIADALDREASGDASIAEQLRDYMIGHETGVQVLAAPRDPADADRISPAEVTKVIDAARKHYDWVVVDTPAALSEIVLAAFETSDELYTMATLDLPSIRNMSVFLSTLEKLDMPSDKVRLVLNKAEHDVGIDVEQVTRLFPRGFDAVLPYAKEVSRSINVGMPVMASSPASEISGLMTKGLTPLLPDEDRARLEAAAGSGGRRLFRRRR